LFQGALWVGGVVGPDKDTLVSVGNDGWVNIREFFPEAGSKGSILRRSTRTSSPFYSPDAISDQDFIAVYYDTLKDPRLVTSIDPETGERFKELGIKVEQRSYSWSAEWGQDWVLLDYTITNMGNEPVKQTYVGLFLDPDIGNVSDNRATQIDDYCGFQAQVVLDSCKENIENLNITYAYDNDGDQEEGADFGLTSTNPTGALGVRVLRAGEALRPNGTLPAQMCFNWWIADSMGFLDWGPQHLPGRASLFGGRGQPVGDRMKYHYLSNQEIDYDQIYSAINQNNPFEPVWLPPPVPPAAALDIADGADSRFLMSVGPFNLGPGESIPVTLAVFVGPGFHTDPANFDTNFPGPNYFLDVARIQAYKLRLDLRGLFENGRMARRVFDNDTRSFFAFCSYFVDPLTNIGESLFVRRFHGDGVPDFKGPIPPPYPRVEFTSGEGEVAIRWFGRETEHARDPISGLQDFEGYSVQMSPDGFNYTIIGYFDRINWRLYYLNLDLDQDGNSFPWEYRWDPAFTEPLTFDEIQRRYAVRWDTCLNKPGGITMPIDPQKYNAPIPQFRPLPLVPTGDPWCNPDTTKSAVRLRFCDNCGPFNKPVDTLFFFVPEGLELGMNQIRMYPSVTDPANDSAYWYQFKISGLLPSQPLWFSVVPFDNGMVTFTQRIEPQEASPYAGAYLVYPIATDSARREEGLKISVYPNPYRVDHDYSFFEKKLPITGHPQSSQRINFMNLPPRCTVRIYTLDGDLVQQINHDKDPNASDSGFDFWDLLSRNAQKVVAGMYIFSVESNEGRYIGKILIIQ
ncbi:MAG: T9SS type A sorting domain-containing protein, partial [Candidatus Zixiibacteriota bacterium]